MRLFLKILTTRDKMVSQVSFRLPVKRPLWQRYGFAVAITLLAFGITLTFYPVFAPGPFLMFWPAVTLTAWFGGFRASLIAIFLSLTLVNYFFLAPVGSFTLTGVLGIRFILYTFVSLLISLLFHREDVLRREQELLRITLASIGDGVIVTDEQGHVAFLNATAQDLTGWTDEAAREKPIEQVFKIVNQYTRRPVENPVKRVLQEGRVVGLANHTMLIDRHGQERPIADSGAPIRNSEGKVSGAVLVFRDVTAEYEAQTALEESENRFRQMADYAPVLLWIAGTDKLLFYFNKPWLDFTGRSLEQELGNGWTEGVHPEDVERCLDIFTTSFDQRQPFTMDYRLRRHDGEYRWVIDNGVPRYNQNGEFLGYIGSCLDITDRKLAEQQSKSLQELTAALSQAVTISQVAHVISEKTLAMVDGHIGIVGLLEEDQQTVRILSTLGAPDSINQQFSRLSLDNEYPLTTAIRDKTPIWIESAEAYVARYPHAANNLAVTQTQAAVAWPLIASNRVVGGMGISFNREKQFAENDLTFLQTITHYCAEALERARLTEQAQETAAIQERNHLARELHDTISQTLFTASAIAQAIPRTWQRDTQKAFDQLETLTTLTRSAYAEMRVLLLEMRPEHLLSLPLHVQYEQLAEALQGRKAVKVTVEVDEALVVPPEIQPTLYRITQEALNNIAKHANAKTVAIRVDATPAGVELCIEDDGQGFDTHENTSGMGMTSMRERAALIGATLEITSAPGSGTQVRLVWANNA